jgi:hypothetical protein
MASPPPTYTSSASLSRSKTSPDNIRSLADEMLRSSLSRTVSSAPSASLARSQASPDDIRSLADEMLRSSLSRGVSAVSPVSSDPPRYNSERSITKPAISAVHRLTSVRNSSCEPTPLATNPVIAGLASSPPTKESGSVSSSSYSGLSAAEAKNRVRQLQAEVNRANAESPQRNTAGIFKKACSTDLLFLIDTTYSMNSYIDAAKQQVKSIVKDIKEAFLNESEVCVAVVGYKDHGDTPNIQFLDFTPSADRVYLFLDSLRASGGADTPEDVLGGIRQAVNASWKQQTRCIIHIADAPPHGRGLHDLGASQDNYFEPGSEPHGLTYENLLKQLVRLNINYVFLCIHSITDRTALAFSGVYAAAGADVKLLPSNTYHSIVSSPFTKAGTSHWSGASTKHSSSSSTELQFEELRLGTTYNALRGLVVKSVTGSVTRTSARLTMALTSVRKVGSAPGTRGKGEKRTENLTAIKEDGDSGRGTEDVVLETTPPKWNKKGWLDETLVVEGFCPDVASHNASTLNEMTAADEHIKLSVAELTIFARTRPFAKGALRVASYARTAASTNRFVIKSFISDGLSQVHMIEDMRIQVLCKAFALEFNCLLKIEPPIDFIVTACLQRKRETGLGNGCLSLEPYIEGEYVKYNSNSGWVKEDSPEDLFNQTAQAFSHFTFERSWGHFLVVDLQGVGHLLTDPSIQTRDHERFKLNPTNLHEEGFKFFFARHECNSVCQKLELKSNREMVINGNYVFRERWPAMDATVCCSNKLCRKIIRLASANESDKFRGYHWCGTCWPQLQSSTIRWICAGPGPNHEFEVSKFFYESQGQVMPRKCPEHIEKDKTVPRATALGSSLWDRKKSTDQKRSISGSSW